MFFNFAPLRSLHDSCGPAHMAILRCQKLYEFQMNFNNAMCYCYVTFKNLTLTNGFGHIFMLSIFLLDRNGLLPSLNFIVVQFKHVFQMFFNVFMLRFVGTNFGHL